MVDRSLLFEPIQKQHGGLFVEMSDALLAIEETNRRQDGEPSRDTVEENEREKNNAKEKLQAPNQGKTLMHN